MFIFFVHYSLLWFKTYQNKNQSGRMRIYLVNPVNFQDLIINSPLFLLQLFVNWLLELNIGLR